MASGRARASPFRETTAEGRRQMRKSHATPSATKTRGDRSGVSNDRKRKVEELRAAGVDPFPHVFRDVVPLAEIRDRYVHLPAGAEGDATLRVAGRMVARR